MSATDLMGDELHEIRGPSALGGGGKRFFELLWLVASTDFRKTYYGSFLGYLWSLLRPLMLFGVLLFVFTQIFFRGGPPVPHYAEWLLLGIVMFTFFQEASSNGVTSVVGRESIVRKTQFPRLVIPLATVLTAFLNFCVNMVAVLIFIVALGVHPMLTWLYFPVIVALVFVITLATSMLLSTLYVRYRDVGIIWGVLVVALMYATPVIYPFESVPAKFQHILFLNPLTPIFVQARTWMIDNSAHGALTSAGGWVYLLPAMAIYAGICLLAIWKFNRDAPMIAEAL
jgi:ABC-2 type transport system permease protein